MPDIVRRLNEAGIHTSLPGERMEQTRVVALSYTIEVSLYCAENITEAEKEIIEQVCQEVGYIDRFFCRAEMQKEYGLSIASMPQHRWKTDFLRSQTERPDLPDCK